MELEMISLVLVIIALVKISRIKERLTKLECKIENLEKDRK
jgi:hypothetical protein